ncbi:MAG: glycosyltransferase, partial [Gemmatimonadaceae bacterium]
GTMRFPGESNALLLVATRGALRRATNVVRATALLAQRHQALRLRVLGSVAYEQDLKLLAAALGLGRRVDWLGFSDGAAAYHGVIAGWVIADGDDAATATLDVMSHGLAVMAERTSVAARYVSDGIHGVTMANLDPALMAAEIALLIADGDMRAAMGSAARLRVEREFPLREMLAGFEQAARGARERVTVRA